MISQRRKNFNIYVENSQLHDWLKLVFFWLKLFLYLGILEKWVVFLSRSL